MTRNRDNSVILHALGGLGWPLIIGLAACSLFYVAIFSGPLDLPVMHRYFTGHPVPYSEAALFFIGLAALLLKLGNLLGQVSVLGECPLQPRPEGNQPLEEVGTLVALCENASERFRKSYFGRRLEEALQHVTRQGHADQMDDELKYLADRDADRQYESFGLVRIVIWATPMLGFLGTVMGIAQALGNLDPTQLATDPANAMKGLLAGLYIAFDTTALALTLSMVLMFVQFMLERVEGELLGIVDQRTSLLLQGRFAASQGSRDPQLASIERMCYAVIRGAEHLVERQTELWRGTIDATQRELQEQWRQAGEQVSSSLTESLQRSLASHAQRLSEIDGQAAVEREASWERWEATLNENARLLASQQQAMQQQGELMSQAIQATGEVVQLEQALNRSLQTLAEARNFEDTMLTLTAAIHLLSSRLGGTADARRIELRHPTHPESERAA